VRTVSGIHIMPIGVCQHCQRKYHFAAKWAKGSAYYGPESCFECSQGATPESWERESPNKSNFDSSLYKEGHFAHAFVKHTCTGGEGEYQRVRIREIHPNGSIITFCGRHFINGEHRDRASYSWTLQPMSSKVEDVILKKEMMKEIDKLWDAHKYNLGLDDTANILEILRSR
jgi:hypothetical protein